MKHTSLAASIFYAVNQTNQLLNGSTLIDKSQVEHLLAETKERYPQAEEEELKEHTLNLIYIISSHIEIKHFKNKLEKRKKAEFDHSLNILKNNTLCHSITKP